MINQRSVLASFLSKCSLMTLLIVFRFCLVR
nr:MAG TPA: hypothetical protein [Caudoviricetes sp.]DAX89935.1 MAG TPA: hypothetical protein [Caudoviricetes sp.]